MIRGAASGWCAGLNHHAERVAATAHEAVNAVLSIALTIIFLALKWPPMSLPASVKPAAQPTGANICLLFRQVRDGLAQRIEQDLAENGYPINLSQFLVLRKLDLLGPMSAIDLARAIDHNPGAMTRLLDRLETMGYLRRTPHAGDRRALRIELTDAGHALSNELRACGDRIAQYALRTLAPDEREQFVALLERVHASL
jgi:DNA-binding MarR family transcriptional regulator